MNTWTVGDVSVAAVADLDPFRLELQRLFPDATASLFEPFGNELAPEHFEPQFSHILLAVQAFLLKVDGKCILIDTCIGEHKPRPRLGAWDRRESTGFLQRLAAAGAQPSDIDFVFCTHLHADHVGWNTRWDHDRWIPTFPRARYLIGRREYEHFAAMPDANHGSFADSVQPLSDAGLIDLVDDGFSLARGVTLLPLPGHSPGQMGLSVDRLGHTALFCGDALHTPAQVFLPRLSSAFCADPLAAATLRLDLFARAADERRVLVPAHFRKSGRVIIEERGQDDRGHASYYPRFEAM